tara:strand:- start:2779 stop:3294 length:516 start_codon:yes stop_codon:yes gene_type:complete
MGKTKLLSIIFVFLSPFIFAYYYYINDATSTRGTTNYGTFLQEQIIIENGIGFDNEHWSLVQLISNHCDVKCQDNIYMLRQVNTALGKDMDRLRRYIIFENNIQKNNVYIKNYPKVIVLDKSEKLYNKLSEMEERIFIADPYGNIILGYKKDFSPKGLLKDIKKLLKFSKK